MAYSQHNIRRLKSGFNPKSRQDPDVMKEYQPIPPGREWSVTLFTPEDAPGVTALFHAVYGKDYPVKIYLDPDALIRENLAGTIVSSVAKTTDGHIVGHNALFNSAPCKQVFESGAGLVHKDYRGGQGIFTQMVAHGLAMGPKKFQNIEQVFGEPVCNHPFSQKMGRKTGFITRALEVNLMPAEAYVKEGSARGRVSTMLDFQTVRSRPCTVYMPAVYADFFNFFYEDMDDDREFVLSDHPLPPHLCTRLTSRVFDFAKVARIALAEPGSDLAEVFRKEEARLLKAGIRVIQVWVPTGVPFAGAAVDCLRAEGYFLGGVLPRWFDSDGLLMGKVLDPPEWENMVLYYPRDQEIGKIVRSDYELSLNRKHLSPPADRIPPSRSGEDDQ